jgi:hypothetical protein
MFLAVKLTDDISRCLLQKACDTFHDTQLQLLWNISNCKKLNAAGRHSKVYMWSIQKFLKYINKTYYNLPGSYFAPSPSK